jgi:uncharacterized protein YdeI (YjbR/CyaY-like superfamily)
MKRFKTVDEYILNVPNGKDILIVLRELIHSTELVETLKWGIPVYTINHKNVVGIASFKSYTGLWFYQGAFLTDKAQVLTNASEGTTKAQRQWRFSSLNEIDDKLILSYLNEAIKNQKLGKEIKPDRNKPIVIPNELSEIFNENKELENCFNRFTKGRQREFVDFVSSAKQLATRMARAHKIIPLILDNIGLNDKYRK